jgi:four helix bundle protein
MPVWKLAMEIAVDVFRLTISLPKSEDYALTSQIRRSSESISANIAEGFGRNTGPDKNRFYVISRGSAFETKNHLIYGNKVKYFAIEEIEPIYKKTETVIHELNKLIKSLN